MSSTRDYSIQKRSQKKKKIPTNDSFYSLRKIEFSEYTDDYSVSSLSYPDQSFDEKTKLDRSSICMEIKINGWIFIRFISPPIFIPRLLTSPAKNSIFYRNFTPLFYPTILLILPPPTTSSEITRIHVRWELVARRARPSMTHDIIGSTLPSSVFNGPRAKFNFFGCNRSNLSDTSYYFSTKLYTGAFFSLSLFLSFPLVPIVGIRIRERNY